VGLDEGGEADAVAEDAVGPEHVDRDEAVTGREALTEQDLVAKRPETLRFAVKYVSEPPEIDTEPPPPHTVSLPETRLPMIVPGPVVLLKFQESGSRTAPAPGWSANRHSRHRREVEVLSSAGQPRRRRSRGRRRSDSAVPCARPDS